MRPPDPTIDEPRPVTLPSLLLCLACSALQIAPASTESVAGFRVEATIEVGAAPHGISFANNGRSVFVAVSGADEIAGISTPAYTVLYRIAAGETPLDVMRVQETTKLITTQFRGDSLRTALPETNDHFQTWTVGKGPSMFGPRIVNGLASLSCEFDDTLVLFDTESLEVVATYDTGDAPYPPDVTKDGVLAFVPNKGDGTVTVVDLLNQEIAATVSVGGGPQGGALLEDDSLYVAACSDADELAWINTATYQVVHRTPGVGPGPFSVTATPDGLHLLVNNAGGDTLSIIDVATRASLGDLTVGEQPIVVRMRPESRQAWVSNEVSGTVSVVALPDLPAPIVEPPPTEVVVLGTIHGGHLTSELYDLDLLRETIRAVEPDAILAEIPPNRAEAALAGFLADGVVSEPRVARFPEYVDVVYPLQDELGFELLPCAAWNEPMARFRSARLAAIREDPARADDWAAYTAANEAADACLAEHGPDDDPYLVNDDLYDVCTELGLKAYDELFNDELGPGGWTNINQAHYRLIEAALDRYQGQGKRLLITYGAGHKLWFLRKLQEREDVVLRGVWPFLDQAHEVLGRPPGRQEAGR
jgi:YVTN family beta-propeller protein